MHIVCQKCEAARTDYRWPREVEAPQSDLGGGNVQAMDSLFRGRLIVEGLAINRLLDIVFGEVEREPLGNDRTSDHLDCASRMSQPVRTEQARVLASFRSAFHDGRQAP
jgi:hypothetical protein